MPMDAILKKRKYCCHCKEYLTPAVFKRHKSEFYDEIKKEWRTKQDPYHDDSHEVEDDNAIISMLYSDNDIFMVQPWAG